MNAEPSNARLWYRIFLNLAAPLVVAATLAEISVAQEERRARARVALFVVDDPGDQLEPVDCSDVLEAHGVEVDV